MSSMLGFARDTDAVRHFSRAFTFVAGVGQTPYDVVLAEYDNPGGAGGLSIALLDMNVINGVDSGFSGIAQAKIEFGTDGAQATVMVDFNHGLVLSVPASWARVTGHYAPSGVAAQSRTLGAIISEAPLSARGEPVYTLGLIVAPVGAGAPSDVNVKPFADAFRFVSIDNPAGGPTAGNLGQPIRLLQMSAAGGIIGAVTAVSGDMPNWVPILQSANRVAIMNDGALQVTGYIVQRIAL